MGWKAGYYYSRKGGGYVGKGAIARAHAGLDRIAAAIAGLDRETVRRARELARSGYAGQRLAAARADRLLAEGMALAGYHRHARGPWRRRKMGDAVPCRTPDAPASLMQIAEDLGALVERARLEHAAGDPERAELLAAELQGVRRALLDGCDSPVLRLAAEHVSHAYLDRHVAELTAAACPDGDPLPRERRRTFAARRYESAMAAFARIRRLECRTLRTLRGPRKPA